MSDSYVIQCLLQIHDKRSNISLHDEVVNVIFHRCDRIFLPDNVWGTRGGMKHYTSYDELAFAVKSMTVAKVLSYDRKTFVGTPEQRDLMFRLKKALRPDGWAAADSCVISAHRFPEQTTMEHLLKLELPFMDGQPKVTVWGGTLQRATTQPNSAAILSAVD